MMLHNIQLLESSSGNSSSLNSWPN